MGIISSDVQGIHDPAGLARKLPALLGQHPVGGEGLFEDLLDLLLGLLVRLGDEIHLPLVFDLSMLSEAAAQHLFRCLGRRNRNL